MLQAVHKLVPPMWCPILQWLIYSLSKKDQKSKEVETSQVLRSKKKAGKERDLSPVYQFAKMQLSSEDDSETEDTICNKCGLVYAYSQEVWICCDGCDHWFDIKCATVLAPII